MQLTLSGWGVDVSRFSKMGDQEDAVSLSNLGLMDRSKEYTFLSPRAPRPLASGPFATLCVGRPRERSAVLGFAGGHLGASVSPPPSPPLAFFLS